MVQRRTGEIGARMALGADRGRVIGMVLGGAFWQVGIGLALGIPTAIGTGKLMADQLFGVQPWDPVMLCSPHCCSAWQRCWHRSFLRGAWPA
jgi:putative ABC transport system permease protein